MSVNRLTILGGLLLAVLSFSAIAGGEATGGTNVVIVEIKDFKFIPAEITVKAGDTIRWVNKEKRQYHSVWFEELGEPEPADYLFPDDSYERVFDAAGTFPYRCGPHPKMRGKVHVE